MSFKEFYKFPFHLDEFGNRVFTEEGEDAFDFFEPSHNVEFYQLTLDEQDAFITCLNSENVHFVIEEASYIYRAGVICIVINNKAYNFIQIRGWGHLIGGLKVSFEEAKKIQDEFAHFIITRLSNCKTV